MAILRQLAEGGRLVTILQPHASADAPRGASVAVLYRRHGDRFPRRPLFDAAASRLVEFARAPQFVF